MPCPTCCRLSVGGGHLKPVAGDERVALDAGDEPVAEAKPGRRVEDVLGVEATRASTSAVSIRRASRCLATQRYMAPAPLGLRCAPRSPREHDRRPARPV